MSKKQRFSNIAQKMGRLIRRAGVFTCLICLIGNITSTGVIHAQAVSGAVQYTADTKTDGPQIGKKTSASRYIKADDWPAGPSVGAESAVLMEAETGTVLYAKNPDTQLYPASITKIMTALLTIENSRMTDVIACSKDALIALPPGYLTSAITPGEKLTVEEVLRLTLMYSANDAANVLGVYHSGSIEAFAEKMNERAKAAGAKYTHFNNPSGLHQENHYTTAYDMCRIMRECVKYPDFNRIGGDRIYTLQANEQRKEAFTFAAKHSMLFPQWAEYYEYCVSGKTGYTEEARNTLVTYAEKDGMKLICCVMKCPRGGTYTDTEALFEYGFQNFSVADVSESEKRFTLKDAGVFASEELSSAAFTVEIPRTSYVVLPNGVSLSKLDTEIQYNEAGSENFADITYLYQGMQMGSASLQMKSGAGEHEQGFDFELHKQPDEEMESEAETGSHFSDIWNKSRTIDIRILTVAAAVVLLVIVIIVITAARKRDDRIHFNKKRRKRRW